MAGGWRADIFTPRTTPPGNRVAANCMDPQMHIDTTQYRKVRNGNLYGSAYAHRYDTVSESSELDFVWIRKCTSISEVSEVRRIGVFKLRKFVAHHQIYALITGTGAWLHSLDAVSDQSLRGRPASVFSSIVAGSSSDGSRSRLSPAYRCRPAPTRCTAFPLGPVVDRLQDSSARIQRGGMRPPAPEQHLSPQLESTYCREYWCNQQRRSGDGSFLQVHTAVILDVPPNGCTLPLALAAIWTASCICPRPRLVHAPLSGRRLCHRACLQRGVYRLAGWWRSRVPGPCAWSPSRCRAPTTPCGACGRCTGRHAHRPPGCALLSACMRATGQ